MTIDLDFLKEPTRFETFRSFAEQCRLRPRDTALVFGEFRQSYAELGERVERLAGALSRRGLGAESRVLLVVTNSPEMIWLLLALLNAGHLALGRIRSKR